MNFYIILQEIGVGTVLIPIFYFLRNIRTEDLLLRWIGVLLALSLLGDYLPLLEFGFLDLITNLFTIIEFVILNFILFRIFNLPKNYLLVIIGAYVGYNIMEFTQLTTLTDRSVNLRLVSCIYFTSLGILGYFRFIQLLPTDNISKFPYFWVSNAFFIYFFGKLFLASGELFISDEKIYMIHIPVHTFFYSIKNLCLARALFLDWKLRQ